jgi:hypothetical protein
VNDRALYTCPVPCQMLSAMGRHPRCTSL